MCKRKTGSWFLVAAICLGCTGCGGCIKGTGLSFVRYDKKADSFSLMDVYANIATDQQDQLNHISKLWRRKDNLIINPVDIHLFGSWSVFERVGKHSYRSLPLGVAMDKEPETLTTSVRPEHDPDHSRRVFPQRAQESLLLPSGLDPRRNGRCGDA